MHRNLRSVSTKRQRIAQLARQSPEMAFTSPAYLIDLDWLHEAYRRTRKDGAAGVDGQTAAQYEEDLGGNLRSLLDRAKSGRYKAPPVRRVHIPKSGSFTETRPIGIPTLEDKVLQRAVVMLLEPIFEQDFYDSSYGFRPGRSAHQALESLWRQSMDSRGGWILEVDIRRFFDTLDHAHLQAFVKRRVCDGVVNRLIGKWLKAGVMEDGNVSYPEAGSPQGCVFSPLAANIYLHYVLDEWFEQIVKPRLKGKAYLIRYGDDFVIGFTYETDARRVMEVLPKRLGKYGLVIHPQKTRLVPFRRPKLYGLGRDRGKTGSRPGTFQFLGFTHFWGRSQKGNWVVQRQTASKRLRRSLKQISHWCRKHRHLPLVEQQQALSRKLHGHFAYFGITGNSSALSSFRYAVLVIWQRWLSRRNRRRLLSWEQFNRLLARYPLPPAKVIHSLCVAPQNHDLRNRMH